MLRFFFDVFTDFSKASLGMREIAGGATIPRGSMRSILTPDSPLRRAGMKNHVIGKRFTEATRRAVSSGITAQIFFLF